MAKNSKIEWCDHSFNPWVGCQKISPGCDHCYAEGWAKRSGLVQWGPHADRRRTSAVNWRQPLKWANVARTARLGWENPDFTPPRRPRVFCASLADVFDNQAPEIWRSDLFALIEDTPELDWLLLTKRPENIREMIWPKWDAGLPSNIWLGFTAENQEWFDRRWPLVAQIPAVVRFCSYEPAIGPLRIGRASEPPKGLDWLICGGESGPRARMMDLQWARNARDDCSKAGIRFFFKQTTGKRPIPADLMVREFPGKEKDYVTRIGTI